MREVKFIIFFLILPFGGMAQTAETAFHLASNQYIHGKMRDAKSTIQSALREYPNDPKLNALKGKLKEEEKKEQDKKNQEDQEKKDKEKKEAEEKQNQKNKQKEQEEKERKEQEQKEQQKKEEGQKEEGQKAKEQKEKEEKEKKDKGQEANDQKKEDQKKKDEIPSDVRKRLQELNLSPEKAQMILDAMKNQEQQYLQQNKRKATKPKDKGKPDW